MHGLIELDSSIFWRILSGILLAQFCLPVRINTVLYRGIFLLIINPRSRIRPESDSR
jgi:hypothetical protein